MLLQRKFLAIILLGLFLVAGIAATRPADEPGFKNLKVLPKDIGKKDLDKIMDGFKAALGVRCSYCHAPSKDSTNHLPDFPSDDKPEKGIARKMIKMTNKINKKYFNYTNTGDSQALPTVDCMTCHHGKPHPSGS